MDRVVDVLYAHRAMDLDHIHEGLRHLAVPCSSLTPDPKNARKHDRRNLDTIKELLTKFGQRLPIVVQKQGMIIRAGNGRFQVAQELGWDAIAAIVVDEADVDAIAFALGDNRSAELAEWDSAVLSAAIHDLGFAATGLGFNDIEISTLTDTLATLDADDTALQTLADPSAELSKANKMASIKVFVPSGVDTKVVRAALVDAVKAWADVKVQDV